jgi:hypothetical protein
MLIQTPKFPSLCALLRSREFPYLLDLTHNFRSKHRYTPTAHARTHAQTPILCVYIRGWARANVCTEDM